MKPIQVVLFPLSLFFLDWCAGSCGTSRGAATRKSYWTKACQVFSILALVAIFSSLVLGVLHILREDTQRLTLPAIGLGVASAVYVAVEVGVFVGKSEEFTTYPSVSYGYGLYLSIVAVVLSVVTAILYVVGRVTVR